DVGARGEGLGPRAAVHDGAHGVVLGEPLRHARDLAPHREADGVAHARAIEDDRGDRAIAPHEDVAAAFAHVAPSVTLAVTLVAVGESYLTLGVLSTPAASVSTLTRT